MLWWTIQNLVITTLLAGIAWSVCRAFRLGPVWRHALWLIVLIKLLTPPLIFWPWAVRDPLGLSDRPLTDTNRPPAAVAAPVPAYVLVPDVMADGPTVPEATPARPVTPDNSVPHDEPRKTTVVAAPLPAKGTPSAAVAPGAAVEQIVRRWLQRVVPWLSGAWIAGGAAIAILQSVRIVQMSRQLRLARPADTALLRQVESVARLLGIRPAAVHLVPGIGSPVIWALRKPLLLWPYELPAGVSDQAVRGLIVHELAHVKRRDHWVGWLELLAGCVWWWNPLFWYVRHQLRENAELACDAWVVSAMPGGREGRRAYAEALLAVCECASNRVYRNNRTAPMPAVGVSTGGRRFLERRLAMILRDKVPLRLPRLGFLSVLLMALGSLPVWAQEAPTGAAPAPQQAAIAADEAGLQRIYTARTISPYGAVMSGAVGEALPKAAQEVLNQLRSRHEEIRREEARKLAQSRADAIAALKEIQDRFTKAGQLDEAVAVRDAVRRLQGERAIAYGPRSFWRAISVSPDPGTLISYRDKVGQTFYFDVTGTKEGTVWGTGTYTDDSALAAAAVHMGVLAPGQRGVIKVTVLPGQESYTGSERNGLTTQSYNEWPGSYRIEPSDLPPGGATIYAPGMPGVGGPALGGGLGAPPPDSETPRSARDTDRWLDAASVANLQQFRDKVGQTFETDLVGSTDGRVWGSDVYTDDSSPAAAAVHAGVLRVGESGRVKITILPGQGSYEGTTRNGITTEPWQSWDGSFRIEKANGPARLERLELKEESRSSGDKPAAILRSF